ncbi:MAG: hypothetical protein JWQ42_4733 [Edaphobacter sp.]|nr:hypothetical protein [Edaphobacter sp.]
MALDLRVFRDVTSRVSSPPLAAIPIQSRNYRWTGDEFPTLFANLQEEIFSIGNNRATHSLSPAERPITSAMRVFYEQVTGVKVCSSLFSFIGFLLLLLLVWLRRKLLSTGFLYAL